MTITLAEWNEENGSIRLTYCESISWIKDNLCQVDIYQAADEINMEAERDFQGFHENTCFLFSDIHANKYSWKDYRSATWLHTHICLDVPRCVESRDIIFGVCGEDLHAEEDAGKEVDAGGPDEDQTHHFEQGVATVNDGVVLHQPVSHLTGTIPLPSHIPEIPQRIAHKLQAHVMI